MKKGSFVYKKIYSKLSISLTNVSEVVLKNTGNVPIYFFGFKLLPGEQIPPIANNSIIDLEATIDLESTNNVEKAHLYYIQHPPTTK